MTDVPVRILGLADSLRDRESSEPPGGENSRARVLVVDDEQALRSALVRLLEFHDDFEVVGQAADGQAALERIGEADVDLVVMDLRMPVLGGIEATRLIRERHSTVRVVLLSAYNDQGLIAEALGAGAFDYLIKGCTAAQLYETLGRAWRHPRPVGEAGPDA